MPIETNPANIIDSSPHHAAAHIALAEEVNDLRDDVDELIANPVSFASWLKFGNS